MKLTFLLPISILMMPGLAQNVSPPHTYTVTVRQGSGHSEIVLVNNGSSAIVAFHALFECGNTKMAFDHDVPIHPENAGAVPPAATSIYRMATLAAGCALTSSAVRHADGSSDGDEDAIQAIAAHRQGASQELSHLRPILEQAAAGTISDEVLTQQLATEDSAISSLATDGETKIGRAWALIDIKRLRNSSVSTSAVAPAVSTGTNVGVEHYQLLLRSLDGWQQRLADQ